MHACDPSGTETANREHPRVCGICASRRKHAPGGLHDWWGTWFDAAPVHIRHIPQNINLSIAENQCWDLIYVHFAACLALLLINIDPYIMARRETGLVGYRGFVVRRTVIVVATSAHVCTTHMQAIQCETHRLLGLGTSSRVRLRPMLEWAWLGRSLDWKVS
jgi:hypothetical protein